MVTKGEVEKVLADHPDLHIAGNGRPHRLPTGKSYEQMLTDNRSGLTDERSLERITAALRWLDSNVQPSRRFDRRNTSYGLKHIAEKKIGYLTNGHFIVAALLAGYKMSDHYNPHFDFRLVR